MPVVRLVGEPQATTFDWSDLYEWVAAAPPAGGPTVAEIARAGSAVIYLDTSLLAAIFFREAKAIEFVARIERMPQRLMISAWTLTEMASVGGIKERTGVVDAATRRQALSTFQRFVLAKLGLVAIEPGNFRPAAVLIDTPVALRTGDALHLAVVRRPKARLASLDRRLCDATDRLGIGRFDLA